MQVNQLLNMYEQTANRQQYEKLQEQLHTQLAQLQAAYNAKAEEVRVSPSPFTNTLGART